MVGSDLYLHFITNMASDCSITVFPKTTTPGSV